jgi:cell division septum initiation protein DivIVA
MENLTTCPPDIRSLEQELKSLREKLQEEIHNLKPCEEYSAEHRIEATRTAIAEKERLLDEAQGREAEGVRKQRAEADFNRANESLAESQAEVEKLRAEYRALPDKIGSAEWRFNQALRAFTAAKEASARGL